MRIHGYELKNDSESDEVLLTLREVTFEITPNQAQELGEFFMRCAREMAAKPAWEHEHLRGGHIPDVVVYKAR